MQFMCFQQLLNPCLHATAVQPCYPCCTPATPSSSKQRFRSRVLPEDGFKVVLAVSPIGRLRGVAGYHTSVLVGGRELCFGISGISTFRRQLSHQENPDLQLIDVGVSCCCYKEVRRVLRKHFLPGTYDILRKNCNSFTDCALYMMCEQRLAWHFRGLDAIGRTADANGVLRSLLPSRYRPNPLSVEWQVEDVIEMIESECTFMHNVSGTDEIEDGLVVHDFHDGFQPSTQDTSGSDVPSNNAAVSQILAGFSDAAGKCKALNVSDRKDGSESEDDAFLV